jgi:hypothetical protein
VVPKKSSVPALLNFFSSPCLVLLGLSCTASSPPSALMRFWSCWCLRGAVQPAEVSAGGADGTNRLADASDEGFSPPSAAGPLLRVLPRPEAVLRLYDGDSDGALSVCASATANLAYRIRLLQYL